MKAVLIYDEADIDYEQWIRMKEFDSIKDMLEFVNTAVECRKIIAAYKFSEKLNFKPVEKVTSWGIES